MVFNHVLSNNEVLELPLAWNVIHQIEHQIFKYHPQPASSQLTLERLMRDRNQSAVTEPKLHVFKLNQSLILPYQGILRLGQDLDESCCIKVIENTDHRQAADEFRDQPILDQIHR